MRVYWTRAAGSVTNGLVISSKLDGTDLVTLHDAGAGLSCTGLTVAKGKLYASCGTTSNSKEIRVCTLPCTTASSMTVFKATTTNLGAIAGDDASGDVFYAIGVPYNQPAQGNVFKIPAAGGSPVQVGTANAQANPVDLVVANNSIYWLNGSTYTSDTPQYNGGVKRALLSALATETAVITTANYFDNGTLSADANNVYFTGRDKIGGDTDVASGSATGSGAPSVFANDTSSYVVSDGTNVYFSQKGTPDELRYCSRTAGCGGGKTLLSPNEDGISALNVDAVAVYWGKFNGELRRIAKP